MHTCKYVNFHYVLQYREVLTSCAAVVAGGGAGKADMLSRHMCLSHCWQNKRFAWKTKM